MWLHRQWYNCEGAGDLVARLYNLRTSGRDVAQLSLRSENLPSIISTQLSNYLLAWKDLSGFMQRALLWDSGFVIHNFR
ncbi:hypothetical protein CCR75_000772 [Bremia lactucae]|uniref:Uncharacterized protein n=1 Tax=Bremia lactucae TaxID=4779 RepID=A0A976IID0_BRELC|nr:hypothetical protein CCR75_000772 [Bremia lactucae]